VFGDVLEVGRFGKEKQMVGVVDEVGFEKANKNVSPSLPHSFSGLPFN
jgi:hypothetical protein